jgi:myo-inositol-1(or 4)-monophosphatase
MLPSATMSYESELSTVVEAVKRGADLLLAEGARSGGPRGEGSKAPVDAEIGALLCGAIAERFTKDSIVCEEGGGAQGTSARAFVIDPNDGTRDFLLGHRENSISVGMVDNGRLVLGVVCAPFSTPMTGPQGLFVSWAKGEPLRCNGEVLEKQHGPDVFGADSIVLVSRNVRGEILENNRALVAPAQVKHCSSIATRFALVAAGFADVGLTVLNPLSSWDFAGGQALLQAAGGDLFGPDGEPVAWEGNQCRGEYLSGYYGSRSHVLGRMSAELYAFASGGKA